MADINGTDDADTLDGTNASDDIDGKAGNDQINGGRGNDKLSGADGNDTLNGGEGRDNLFGGDGDDRLTDNVDGGDGKLDAGDGDDIISISRTASAKDKLTVLAGAGNDTLTFTSGGGSNAKLEIDMGRGSDIVNVEAVKEVSINSGGGTDTVNVETSGRAHVHAGGDVDNISAGASVTGTRSGISAGKGDDQVTLNLDNDAHFRLKLGEGQDVVQLSGHTGIDPTDPLIKIKDFVGGDSGDKLDLDAYLTSVLTGTTGANAFADGHLRLVQDGTDAHLQIDLDGSGAGAQFVDLVIFQNANVADFNTFNFDGLDPTATPASSDFEV
jgi:Ca2+-binding RTX toxin-like protein